MPKSFVPYGTDPPSPGRRSATMKGPSETRDSVTAQFEYDEVIVRDHKIRSFKGAGASFRIPGNAALAQPLWSIENTSGSAVSVAIRRLQVTMAQSIANTTHAPWFYLFRTTVMPTGGTVMTKANPDGRSSQTSAANVIVRQGASVDGTATPAIVAPVVLPRLASMHGSNMGTNVGQITPLRNDMLAGLADEPQEHGELILGPAQAYVLHVTHAAAADNLTTKSYIVDFAWSEFTDM